MENITPYNIYEWIALIASIIVGSSAYMFFIAEKKNQHLRTRYVMMVLLVNTIFTWIASEILRYKGWGEVRGIVLIAVAQAAEVKGTMYYDTGIDAFATVI